MIKAIYKKLYNAKVLALKTLVLTPSTNKIKVTIFKPDLLNTNPKPAVDMEVANIANCTFLIRQLDYHSPENSP